VCCSPDIWLLSRLPQALSVQRHGGRCQIPNILALSAVPNPGMTQNAHVKASHGIAAHAGCSGHAGRLLRICGRCAVGGNSCCFPPGARGRLCYGPSRVARTSCSQSGLACCPSLCKEGLHAWDTLGHPVQAGMDTWCTGHLPSLWTCSCPVSGCTALGMPVMVPPGSLCILLC
jgi:hypothetical protein